MLATPELQVLLPIHNEEESIAATVREIYAELSPLVRMEFLLCEDGSRDNTRQVVRDLAKEFPATLLLSEDRKGYSRAVRDGMMAVRAPFLLCLDSDGQCDPKDFREFWKHRNDADVLIGQRVNRADNAARRIMSRTFYVIWKALFPASIHDPSCPFILARREVIEDISGKMGAMQEGFWWEFSALISRSKYQIKEYPIRHRMRAAGMTQVYKLKRLPGIGYQHFVALFRILQETKSTLR